MIARARDFSDLSDVFLTCRTMGHAWEARVTFITKEGKRKAYDARWYCEREARAGVETPTEKMVVSFASGPHKGQLARSARYYHASGYLMEPQVGIGRGRSRPMARAELMDRLWGAEEAPTAKLVPERG